MVYVNPLVRTVVPKWVDTIWTLPVIASGAAPAMTTTCVADWLTICWTGTPARLTCATSVPSPRLDPKIATSYPPRARPMRGATP